MPDAVILDALRTPIYGVSREDQDVFALAHELRRRGARYGVATMCVGVGQGMAAVIENPAT